MPRSTTNEDVTANFLIPIIDDPTGVPQDKYLPITEVAEDAAFSALYQAKDTGLDGVPAPALLPTAALAQTIPRTATLANVAVLTTAKQSFALIELPAGITITHITFVSGTTAADTPLNQWFSLYSPARAKLAVTADDETTAWAANTAKTLELATPYEVSASGFFYVGIHVKATTPPSLVGITGHAVTSTLPPIISGYDNTNTLTNPASAPATAAALTVSATMPYAYVSYTEPE